MNRIGIIQGRLSPRPYPKLQEFPDKSWSVEFLEARKIGFDCIEWIFERDNYKNNPIWTKDGRQEIKKVISEYEVTVESVCADYFLECPFYRREGYTLEDNIEKLQQLIVFTSDIGGKIILLPVLEKAELRTQEEKELLVCVLTECIPQLEKNKVKIGLETELPASEYLAIIQACHSESIGAYYDAGNCAYKGYDMQEDMELLKNVLFGVHIKDRIVGEGSVFLGEGNTNFKEGIPYLTSSGYTGNYILQTYFEDDPVLTATKNLNYMRKLIGEQG